MKDKEKTGEANYDERFIDTTTITMEWLQSFERVRQKIQQLTATSYLAEDAAQKALRDSLMTNGTLNSNGEVISNANTTPAIYLPDGSTEITPWQGKISYHYHSSWQFQHITIDGSFLEKTALAIQGPDDLFASLGVFSLNAALSKALIRRLPFNQLEVIVTEVAIYARDTYDFNDSLNDEENDKKPDAGYNTDSQYLGHWNKNDVKLAPISAEFSNQPLVTSWPPSKDNTYFCVRDVHYRKWREYRKNENHGKGHGGDLMIYSNAITVPTSFKIIISL